MKIAVIHFIILGVISGLAKGAGVLPDVQNAAEGETVMFKTTLTPPETPFSLVTWRFGERNIISFDNRGNTTGSEYEGRITLFLSTGSLQLRDVSLNDSGEYKVVINPVGDTFGDGAVRLDVYVPVSNVQATASSTEFVEFNSSVRLSCSSSGSSLSFLWMNGSSEVTASDRVQLTDGGANLTIVNVTRYDEGPFVCRVSNPVSHNDSDPIKLSISYSRIGLVFVLIPTSQPVQCCWRVTQRDTANLYPRPSQSKQVSSQRGSPRLTTMRTDDPHQHGVLSGASSNHPGLAKGAGLLPDVQNTAEGETVMFKTTATPQETPFSLVNWRFGDRTIINFDNGGNTTGSEYEGRITIFLSTGSLQLRHVSLNDGGEYKVTVFPVGGTVGDGAVRLDVYVPVSNVQATASSTEFVEFNSSVRLSCSSPGSSLSFLWMNGSSEVTASDRVQLTDGGSSLTLTIVDVTRYDEGQFVCRVSNPVSHGDSDPIKLSISYGPENVRISPSQEYHEEGSNISLSCSADSRPAAQFQWFLNGDLLPDTGPELILMNIQMSQRGNYSCQAFNSKTLRYQTSQSAAVTVLSKFN
ncbi:hypothetical protein L3Q82_002423 [Scortum barcoo]|uniref:Uncharacterized protein n=1 Tax=Scortum barcoo TaxID=214431 RepID=A0ACB8W041_9TELE|nr:hypothetical protein L3Q82_002423 [Scortum barcoo]